MRWVDWLLIALAGAVVASLTSSIWKSPANSGKWKISDKAVEKVFSVVFLVVALVVIRWAGGWMKANGTNPGLLIQWVPPAVTRMALDSEARSLGFLQGIDHPTLWRPKIECVRKIKLRDADRLNGIAEAWCVQIDAAYRESSNEPWYQLVQSERWIAFEGGAWRAVSNEERGARFWKCTCGEPELRFPWDK